MSLLTKFERFDPFDEMTTLRNRMDRLWNRFTTEEPVLANWAPVSDVFETKDAIVIKAELPGIDEKEIDVEIENGVLMIQGERKAEKEIEEKGYRRVERTFGSFFRSFALPPYVDAEKITAIFNNGILEVRLPKTEAAKPRTVKVAVKKQLPTAA
jgi:HSP20 family protein